MINFIQAHDNANELLAESAHLASESFLTSKEGVREVDKFRQQGSSAVYATVIIKNKKDPRFYEAKQKELKDLIEK